MNSTAMKKSSSLSSELSLNPWSDELMAIWVPIAVYWIQCSIFEILMRLEIPFFEKYRIHSPQDRNKRNKVGFGKVLLMVALQHVVQIVLGIALMKSLDPDADQMKYDNAINRYTTIALNILTNLGQPKDAAFAVANNVAYFIQNYIVPCVQFFIAM
jgi:sphinganine C4-monooxygenase